MSGPSPEEAAEMPPAYRWAVLAFLVLGDWPVIFTAVSIGLLLPSISPEFSLSPAQKGLMGSAITVGNVLFALPFGIWLSRYNPKNLTTLAFLGLAMSTFLMGAAPSFIALLLARFLFGVFGAALMPARILLIQQWFAPREIALVNGIAVAAIGVAEVAALSLTPFLEGWLGGWRNTLHLYGGLALLSVVVWASRGKTRRASERGEAPMGQRGAALATLVKFRRVWLIGIAAMGATFAWSAFLTFWPTYMLERFGMPIRTSGFVFGLLSLGQVPASLWMGYMASRTAWGLWLVALCGVVMASGHLAMLFFSQSWVLAPISFATGIGWGALPILMAIPYQLPGIRPREVAVAGSLISTMLTLGAMLAPTVTGLLIQLSGSSRLALAAASLASLTLAVSGVALGWLSVQDARRATGYAEKPLETPPRPG